MKHEDVIHVVLRIIAALDARRHPDSADIAILRAYAADMPEATLPELCRESVLRAVAACTAARHTRRAAD